MENKNTPMQIQIEGMDKSFGAILDNFVGN